MHLITASLKIIDSFKLKTKKSWGEGINPLKLFPS